MDTQHTKRPLSDEEIIRAIYLLDLEVRSGLQMTQKEMSEADGANTVALTLSRIRQLLWTSRLLAKRFEECINEPGIEAAAMNAWIARQSHLKSEAPTAH